LWVQRKIGLMEFEVRLWSGADWSAAQKAQAAQVVARTLVQVLGDAALVAPVYGAARALLDRYGDNPDPHALTPEEFLLLSQWQQAQQAALQAVFGPHRHLDEGGFDLVLQSGT
jgi:hypothetical protein